MENTVDKVLKIAEAEVGYLEKKSNANLYDKTANAGSGNYTKYGKEMHDIYPSVMDFPAAWCDAFVDWCFYKAYGVCNAKGLIGGDFNDYTPGSAQLYKNKNAWYTSNPLKGDQIFFKNNVRICHTGLVYNVDSKYVYTYEGNCSDSVGARKYLLTDPSIAGYGRPKYDGLVVNTSVSTPTPTPAVRNYLMKGDKGAEVKIMQENLIYLGYSCGRYGADSDFGNDSDAALRKFQKDNHLVVDGKYGVNSKSKLEALVAAKKEAESTPKPTPTPTPVQTTIKAGTKFTLNNTPVYNSESGATIGKRTGTWYAWEDEKAGQKRIKMTNSLARVGVKGQVSFFVDVNSLK